MSEQGGWTTPAGWGPPTPQEPAPGQPAAYGQPPYDQPSYGQAPSPGQPPAYGPGPGWQAPPKPGVVPLRPLGLGELLDGAVGVLRRYPRPALGLSAVVAVVSTLLNVGLLLTAFRPFVDVDGAALETGSTDALEAAIGGAAVGGLLAGVLALLAGAVLTGVLTAVVGRAVLGQPMTLGEAWAQVRPVLLRLVGCAFTVAAAAAVPLLLGLFLGVLLLVLGGPVLLLLAVPLMLGGAAAGVYLYVRLSLAPCALVLEKVGLGASLRRSSVLVKGDWWRVFGISLLTFAVAQFVTLVLQVPFELVGYGSPGDLFSGADALSARALVASSVGSIVGATLVAPFTSGVRALLYVDRRMRAEGLDVALTAAAAQGR